MIYFGCIGKAGHYAWVSERSHGGYGGWNRWFMEQDGKLAPRDHQREFEPTIHHLFDDTVTVIAYWDRSVDTRPGSNSMFLAEGRFALDEMLAMARDQFPTVYTRASWRTAA